MKVLQIWNKFFVYGKKILIKTIITTFVLHKEQIMSLKDDELYIYLLRLSIGTYEDERQFFTLISSLKLTNRTLDKLSIIYNNTNKTQNSFNYNSFTSFQF